MSLNEPLAAGRRLAPWLDGTILPIQGPPGTGKTHTGARMILDLVQHGRHVGVTAQSHRVIANLLEAVARASTAEGIPLRIGQRADEDDDAGDDERIERIRTTDKAIAGLRQGTWDVIGGTSWGQPLPESYRADDAGLAGTPLVFWLVHHDVRFPGYHDAGHFEPHEIPGIDVMINGHIHRSLADVVAGCTTWLNPGNIARVKRGDSTRDFVPRVLRIDVERAGWHATPVELPHEPFDQVFHAEIMAESIAAGLAKIR